MKRHCKCPAVVGRKVRDSGTLHSNPRFIKVVVVAPRSLHGVPVYHHTLATSSSLSLQPFSSAKEAGIMIMPSALFTTLQTLVC